MTKFNTAAPYIACYVILRKDGKFVSLLRSNTGWMDGYYGLPAGKVEKSETFLQGAVREAEEEIGVNISQDDLRHVLTVHRYTKEDKTSWVDVYFEATKWAGEPQNAEPHMHSELTWLELDNLPSNVTPAIGHALHEIAAGKTYSEFGWDE